MKPMWLTIVLCALVAGPGNSAAQQRSSTGTGSTEDQVFDANRQPRMALLQQLYEEKAVLVLAAAGEVYETDHEILNQLVEQVGQDPRLRYIGLEIDPGDSAAYERLSFEHLSVDSVNKLQKLNDVCGGDPAKAYTLLTLFPLVQAINDHRPAGQKLQVIPLAGGGDKGPSWQFWTKIWKHLRPSEKAVVSYYAGHVVKIPEPASWGEGGARTWTQELFIEHPEVEAQIAIVGVDYLQESPLYRLAERQSTRYSGASWGIRLAPFRHVASLMAERGQEMLVSYSGIWEGSQATLPDVADALVWEAHPVRSKAPSDYLPTVCPAREP